MSAAIEVKNLSYSYAEEKLALDGVSFSVEEGSYVTIIGHNGSGKSTLAKVLLGLIERKDGDITILDMPLDKSHIVKIRSRVGIVFQNPDNQFVGSTVADDIAFGLENRQVPQEEMDGIINQFATATGMQDFLGREPISLSGGQKQRVAIAGVLAMRPDIIVFDEATAMLDPKGKEEIRVLIAKMKEENPKLTILSITHDVEEAALSDQVIILNDGKLLFSGSPEDCFTRVEDLRAIKLDVPFAYALRYALAKKGFEIPSSIKTMEALEDYLCR